MPRKKNKNFTRDVGVDVRFKSPVVQKFINVVMRKGKKSIAQTIVYKALDVLVKKNGGDEQKGLAAFEKALAQVRPAVEVKSRRVGGGVYQIPVEVRPTRAQALTFRWIVQSAAARGDQAMWMRLAAELVDASEGRGNAYKKKIDVHRMAEANRAFSHYAW